jgi:hypothetical protein
MVAHDQISDDVDWVSAQAQCNVRVVFERLRTRVREDVQKRNGLLGRPDGWRFEFDSEDDAFEVARLVGAGPQPSVTGIVTFERAGRRILIHSEDVDVDLTVVVALDVGGACRLVVGEAMYSDWEIRRMALEQLFFEETEESE